MDAEYDIKDVSGWRPAGDETLGTKKTLWLRDPDSESDFSRGAIDPPR